MIKPLFATVALLAAALFTTANIQAQDSQAQDLQTEDLQAQEIQTQDNNDASGATEQRKQTSDTEQNERYQALRISIDANQKGPTVTEALAGKLLKANQAEIELAQLAMDKSDNDQVRQFAEQLVQDHRAMNESLQQFAGTNRSRNLRTSDGNRRQRDDRASRDDNRYLNDRADTDAQDRPNRGQDDRAEKGQRDRSQRIQTLAQQKREAANRNSGLDADEDESEETSQFAEAHSRTAASQTVPKQLCQIGDEACDNALRMTKEMLNKYDGQDFNMAFLGQQCVAHTMMLAELKAIESSGPEELRSVAQQASGKVEQHLKRAKELAQKFEDDKTRS